ncbi:MAG TPA: hypothetical protein VN253_11190 [Kofleriaceae bacterium]|nr:hypothetical protein [Kofleriaceae bacterium]
MTLWVFPSGDVHLVAASNMTIDLRIVVQIPTLRTGEWKDASTVDDMTVAFRQVAKDPAGVLHAVAGFVGEHGPDPLQDGVATPATVTPSAIAGTSFHVVTAELGNDVQKDRGVVRITTHTDVTALLAGDRSLSMFAGEADRVLTVYARFTGGAFEDVTGHPWLAYHSANEAIARVDTEGRIHAVSTGATSVHVTTWDGRFGFVVPVTVRPGLASGLGASLIVDELRRKTARHKTTLYVIAEGYRDHARFFDRARLITRVLFETPPYNRIADRFHAVGVFLPSPDQGLTIGPRLLATPGLAADERQLWRANKGNPFQPPVERLFTRDTLFGLMAGIRLFSTARIPSNSDDAVARVDFVRPPWADKITEISPDERRLPRFGLDTATSFTPIPPNAAFASIVRRYLVAAGQTVGSNDRVAFLVDDEYYGGLKLEILGVPLNHFPMVAFPTGFSTTVHGVGGAAPVLDRAPVPGTFDAWVVGSRMAHELGHTYRLGDEYEGETRRIYRGIPVEIEANENVQHDSTLRLAGAQGPLRGDPAAQPPLPPSKLDVTRIKWNIHRIAKASPAQAITAVGNNARLTLERGQARRWDPGERAFVRNSLITPKNTRTEPRTVAVAVQVITTDATHDTVDVTLPPSFAITTLGDVPLLYVPKRNGAGVELGLIDPAVLSFLANQGPFPKPASQVTWKSGPYDPPAIPGFSAPSVKADAIGLHEGGVGYSRDVFRPSGRCKMRNPGDFDANGKVVFDGFCFVCQYVLVELNDPSKHEALDRDYPRDC